MMVHALLLSCLIVVSSMRAEDKPPQKTSPSSAPTAHDTTSKSSSKPATSTSHQPASKPASPSKTTTTEEKKAPAPAPSHKAATPAAKTSAPKAHQTTATPVTKPTPTTKPQAAKTQSTETTKTPPKSTTDHQSTTPQHPAKNATPTTSPAQHAVSTIAKKPAPHKTEGPDTQNVNPDKIGVRGNWVKKRTWLLKAKTQNSKVQDLIVTIQESRKPFWVTYRDIQEEIDTFYQDMGPKLEDIRDVYPTITKTDGKDAHHNHTQSATKESKNDAPSSSPTHKLGLFSQTWNWLKSLVGLSSSHTPSKTSRHATAQNNSGDDEETHELRKKYQDFTKLLDDVKKLDKALEERIEKLDDVVSKAVEDARTSLTLYNDIWDIIDDTKAEHNFYQIKTITKQLKAMHDYITQTLHNDFTSMVKNTKSHMSNARSLAAHLLKEEVHKQKAEDAAKQKTTQEKTPESVHIEEVLKQKEADAKQALKEGAEYAKQEAQKMRRDVQHAEKTTRSLIQKTGGFFKNIWHSTQSYLARGWSYLTSFVKQAKPPKKAETSPSTSPAHHKAPSSPPHDQKTAAK